MIKNQAYKSLELYFLLKNPDLYNLANCPIGTYAQLPIACGLLINVSYHCLPIAYQLRRIIWTSVLLFSIYVMEC